MTDSSRREFLAFAGRVGSLMGLCGAALPQVAEALTELKNGRAPVLWLQGQSCSGCSVSFLNVGQPGPVGVLTRYISLRFHSTLSTATGHTAVDLINRTVKEGGYVLVVEGAIPAGMPQACRVGHEPITEQVVRAARAARAVLAVGTCAAFGGVPAAENNPTGAMSVPDYLAQREVTTPVVRIPGCPAHPDWLVGTLVHLLKFGMPELDAWKRPLAFYGRRIHDQCPRFADYERERFAEKFSDEGCLFKLGCLGPITFADCTRRLWDRGTNTCINAGGPCIGCASGEFARRAALPFYRKGETPEREESTA